MKGKRRVALAALLICGWWGSAVLAQDGTDPADAATEATEGEETKNRRFALYLETQVGSGSSDEINLTAATGATAQATSFLDIDSQDYARASIGWQLPEGKGSFRVVFNGHKETDYSFRSQALSLRIIDESSGRSEFTDNLVAWWDVSVQNGQLTSSKQQPTWNPSTDDANGNGFAETSELRFLPVAGGTSRAVADSLQNQIQTVDLLFQRGWGGRTINATWGAGARVYAYEGNLPFAAWLRSGFDNGRGFTDGSLIRLISLNQESTGVGPTGFVEVHFNFLRDRLQLLAGFEAAFIVQDQKLRSNEFVALVSDSVSNVVLPAPAQLVEDLSKDIWHTGGFLGARVGLGGGVQLHLSLFRQGYLDALLVPTELAVPQTVQTIGQGVTALYKTKDIIVDGVRGGISIQF